MNISIQFIHCFCSFLLEQSLQHIQVLQFSFGNHANHSLYMLTPTAYSDTSNMFCCIFSSPLKEQNKNFIFSQDFYQNKIKINIFVQKFLNSIHAKVKKRKTSKRFLSFLEP